MRFIDPSTEPIAQLANAIFGSRDPENAVKLKLESALIVDVISMFGQALQNMPYNFAPAYLDCSSDDGWPFGTTLINLVKGMKFDGYTGIVKFDTMGYRSNFGLDVYHLMEDGVFKLGNWTTPNGLNITYVPPPPKIQHTIRSGFPLANMTFVVITALVNLENSKLF